MPYAKDVETISVSAFLAHKVFGVRQHYRWWADGDKFYLTMANEHVPTIWEHLSSLDKSVRRRERLQRNTPIVRSRLREIDERDCARRPWFHKQVFIAI